MMCSRDDNDEQMIRRIEESIQRSLELLAELDLASFNSKEATELRESTQTLVMQLRALRRSKEH
jgi:hypothetical protein